MFYLELFTYLTLCSFAIILWERKENKVDIPLRKHIYLVFLEILCTTFTTLIIVFTFDKLLGASQKQIVIIGFLSLCVSYLFFTIKFTRTKIPTS